MVQHKSALTDGKKGTIDWECTTIIDSSNR